MENRLKEYFSSEPDVIPPALNEMAIQIELDRRRRKMAIMLISIATPLWLAAYIAGVFAVGGQNRILEAVLFLAAMIQLIGSGIFSCIVLKFKKIGGRI